MRKNLLKAAMLATALMPSAASAHSFGTLYTLPVPIWLYLYGSAAALALSFLVIGYFAGTPETSDSKPASVSLPRSCNVLRSSRLQKALKTLSVALLILSIASGLFGTQNSYANFNMTFFWIVILLGYAYWVAIAGDSYDVLNPWRAIVEAIEKILPGVFAGRRAYTEYVAHYPALLFYAALIWLELLGNLRPFSLSVTLLCYTVASLLGAWWWGHRAWFEYCDFFAVFYRLLGKISPLQWAGERYHLRPPFLPLVDRPCSDFSLLVFVLFMLSSTAYDGIHQTVICVRLYWLHIVGTLQPWLGSNFSQNYPLFKQGYLFFQTIVLLISLLVYLAGYVAALCIARWLTRTDIPLRRLCLEFAYPLIPIAFVYNVTHYYTLLVSQGVQIIRLVSDPFGFGWNLFGTRQWLSSPITLDVGVVWHTQVGLILLGHIAGVYLSHLVAVRLFPNTRTAIISQLPMLVLMMLFTSAGLWILSLPIQPGGT